MLSIRLDLMPLYRIYLAIRCKTHSLGSPNGKKKSLSLAVSRKSATRWWSECHPYRWLRMRSGVMLQVLARAVGTGTMQAPKLETDHLQHKIPLATSGEPYGFKEPCLSKADLKKLLSETGQRYSHILLLGCLDKPM